MKGVKPIAWKETKTMMHEKSFIMVLVFEILLVSSSTFLAVGYDVLTSPESSSMLRGVRNFVVVGIVSDSKKEFGLPFKHAGITYFAYKDLESAEREFNKGVIDAIIIGNVDLTQDPSIITIYLPSNTPKIGLIRLSLKRFFLNIEDKLRAIKSMIYVPDLRFLAYSGPEKIGDARYFEVFYVFTIPLLFFMPTVMAGSLIIDSLSEEMESKRILNLMLAPLRSEAIVIGKCLGSLIVTIPHGLIWVIVLSFTYFKVENHLGVLFFFILYSVFFILSGAIISLFMRHNRQSQLAYTFIAIGAISLFSPSANMSDYFITFSPAYIITNIALGASIFAYGWQILTIITVNIALLIVLLKSSKRLSIH